jgi:hypothetical protein
MLARLVAALLRRHRGTRRGKKRPGLRQCVFTLLCLEGVSLLKTSPRRVQGQNAAIAVF